MYRYIGTNGIIESPVHLEDIYFVRFIKLIADDNKILTNGKQSLKVVRTTEEEEGQWKEVKA
jgi:hypothetical protein